MRTFKTLKIGDTFEMPRESGRGMIECRKISDKEYETIPDHYVAKCSPNKTVFGVSP
jgi:hypothetical protein